jgi:hypothetical protein
MAVQDQLALVAKKEGFSISGDLGARVAVASARNLRRALLMLEVAYVQHGAPLPEDTKISPPDWEMYIMVRECSTTAWPVTNSTNRRVLLDLVGHTVCAAHRSAVPSCALVVVGWRMEQTVHACHAVNSICALPLRVCRRLLMTW